MKQLLFLIAILLVLNTNIPAQSNNLIDNPEISFKIKVFESWIESKIAYESWPGISIGIVYDQELIYAKAFGYANIEKKIPTTINTKYVLASNTKQFTAIAIMKLRDEGKLDLNDPVEKYFPEINKIQNPFPNSPKITIKQLLTHTSGLQMDPAFPYWNDYKVPSIVEIKEKLTSQSLIYPPEKRWKYSNLEYMLLGEIVSRVAGIAYTEFVTKNILEPLEMRDSYINDKALVIDNMAVGYSRKVPGGKRSVLPNPDYNSLVPAGGLISSLSEISMYLKWQFRLRDTNKYEVLKASTLREMQSAQWIDPGWKMAWGFGFLVHYKDPNTLVSHGGHVWGFRSEIAVIKDKKIGVICLANADDIIPYADMPESVTSNIFEWVIPDIINALDVQSKLKENTLSDYTKYEGKFKSVFDDIQIISGNGELVLINPQSKNPLSTVIKLKHLKNNNFVIDSEDGFGNIGETLTFNENDKGEVISYSIGASVYNKVTKW